MLKMACFRVDLAGTRIALTRGMTTSTKTKIGSELGSMLRTRAALFTPVFSALLAFSSLASAEEPSTQTAPDTSSPSAAPAPAVAAPAAPADPNATAAATTADTTQASPIAVVQDPAPPSVLPDRPAARVHQGFYLRLTSGPSFMTLNGHGPYGSASLTNAGYGGMIAIGGSLAPGFVLAGTLSGSAFNAEFKGGPFEHGTVDARGKTYTASDRATAGFGMMGVLVDWYPKPSGGWHAGAATGVGAVVLTNAADDRDFGGLNFAGSVFGGYDWSLGRKWSLGLQLVASGGTRTKLVEEDESDEQDTHDTGYRLTPFSVGVQASLLYF